MKKLLLSIPFLLLFIHIMFAGDGPNTWTQDLTTTVGVWQRCIAINSTNQLIMYAGTNGAGVYKTTNGGLTWVQSNTGLTNLGIFSLEISKSNPSILYAGTIQTGGSPGVYKTTDGAATWTGPMNTGITESSIAIASMGVDPTNPNNVYITIFDGLADASVGVFKTTNGGTSWAASNTGIGTVKNFLSIVINPLNANVIYIGSSFGVTSQMGPQKVYRSNNAGGTWVDMSSGLPPAATDLKAIRTMSISNTDTALVLAGLFNNTDPNGGAWVTTNGGTSWTRRNNGLPNLVGALPRSSLIKPGNPNEMYMGFDVANTTVAGVYRSTDKGLNWSLFNTGTMTATNTVRALEARTVPDSTIYAGVAGGAFGVHEYTFIPLGIHNPGSGIPTEFALYQNYPNPFNPATIINYDIPKSAQVSINIYNGAGKLVQTLVNDFKQAGSYSLQFNGTNLSSGIYFYKISAGNFTETKKMILVK